MTARLDPAVRPFAVTHGGVFRLAVPMTLAYLSTPIVGVVDTAVIGQLGRAALIGGIAIGALTFDVLFSSFNFLRASTTGLTAQAIGAGEAAEEQSVLFRAVLIALAAGVLMLLLQRLIGVAAIAALGIGGEVAAAALVYISVRIWSAPFSLLNFAVLGWVIGRGESGAGLLLQTLLNGVNIALSIFFVLGARLGCRRRSLGHSLPAKWQRRSRASDWPAWKLKESRAPRPRRSSTSRG